VPAPRRARARAETRRGIDACVPELVVGRALFRVGENLVGLLRLLEFVLGGAFVIRIAVRMVLHRELAIGLLDLVVGSVPIEAEHCVVVAFGHRVQPCAAPNGRWFEMLKINPHSPDSKPSAMKRGSPQDAKKPS
jgi:hypothetical protein